MVQADRSGSIPSSTPDPNRSRRFRLGNDDGTGARSSELRRIPVGTDRTGLHTYDGDFDFNGRVNIDDYFAARPPLRRGQATADDYFSIDKALVKQEGGVRPGTNGANPGRVDDVYGRAGFADRLRLVAPKGSDANDGLSKRRRSRRWPARRRASRARTSRTGSCSRRGDVWTGERFASWNKGGRAPQEPMLISAYGAGAERPLVQYGGPGGGVPRRGERHSDLAIVGIHFMGLAAPRRARGCDRTSPGTGS